MNSMTDPDMKMRFLLVGHFEGHILTQHPVSTEDALCKLIEIKLWLQ